MSIDSIAPPKHLTSLATSSQLIMVDVHVWTGQKSDKRVSDEVTTAKNADNDSGKFVKQLLAGCAEHKALLNNRQTVTNWLNIITLDWAGKWRNLPNFRRERFHEEYAAHEKRTLEMQETFFDVYPFITNKAVEKQGALYSASDYPRVEELRHKFGIELHKMPVPTDDFRCAITAEALEDDRTYYRQQTQRYVDTITAQVSENLVAVIESIAHSCDVTQSVGKDGEIKIVRNKLYDKTLHKALEMCDMLKTYSVVDNPAVEQARVALERVLSGVNADALRGSEGLRSQVRNEMTDILSKFRV